MTRALRPDAKESSPASLGDGGLAKALAQLQRETRLRRVPLSKIHLDVSSATTSGNPSKLDGEGWDQLVFLLRPPLLVEDPGREGFTLIGNRDVFLCQLRRSGAQEASQREKVLALILPSWVMSYASKVELVEIDLVPLALGELSARQAAGAKRRLKQAGLKLPQAFSRHESLRRFITVGGGNK